MLAPWPPPKAVVSGGGVVMSLVWVYCLLASFKTHSPIFLPQPRLSEPQPTSLKRFLPWVPQDGNSLTSSCLETTAYDQPSFPLPQSALLHSRHPDILKVHRSPRRSEKCRNTPSRFPRRRMQKRCRVLCW